MSDTEETILSADTLAALHEFLLEKKLREERELNDQKEDVEENWQLSQFWYNQSTKARLSSACKNIVDEINETSKDQQDIRIGLLSCPSLYPSVKAIHHNVRIFEYDERFSKFGDDFVFYDFNKAFDPEYLEKFKHTFDLIIVDPPFLSEDCIKKIARIVNMMRKAEDGKVILCSGEVIKEWALQFMDLQQCAFSPEHDRNLGNEFTSYANFPLDEYIASR